MIGISTLMKETPQKSLVPSITEEHSEKASENGSSLDNEFMRTLILDFLASRTMSNTFLLLISYLVWGIWVAQLVKYLPSLRL